MAKKRWFYIIKDGNKKDAICKGLLVSAYGEFLNQIFWNQDKPITIDLVDDEGNEYYSWVNGKVVNRDIDAWNELNVICGHRRQQI